MKKICYLLSLFSFAYFLRSEWLVYQHYLVINRDYYPIMSEFCVMYAERAANFVAQITSLALGFQAFQFSRCVRALSTLP